MFSFVPLPKNLLSIIAFYWQPPPNNWLPEQAFYIVSKTLVEPESLLNLYKMLVRAGPPPLLLDCFSVRGLAIIKVMTASSASENKNDRYVSTGESRGDRRLEPSLISRVHMGPHGLLTMRPVSKQGFQTVLMSAAPKSSSSGLCLSWASIQSVSFVRFTCPSSHLSLSECWMMSLRPASPRHAHTVFIIWMH